MLTYGPSRWVWEWLNVLRYSVHLLYCCFTGTIVHILTQLSSCMCAAPGVVCAAAASVYLLYWYKSTNTVAAEYKCCCSAWRGMRGGCFSVEVVDGEAAYVGRYFTLLALVVPTYKN